MSAPNSGFDFQAMGHELRTNRKTQAALVGMVLVLGFMAYTLFGSDAPKGRRPVDTKTGVSLDARQLQGLRKLPDLAALDKAGQLPPLAKVQRDLFMFEAPAPPPPPVKVVVPPPPPPPTAEQLAAQQLAQAKAANFATRPQDLRYMGYFKGDPSGTIGAFMKGEEPLTLVQGSVTPQGWKLVTVLDTRAEFQSTKYPDLRQVLEVREATGGVATNQF